MNDTTIHLLIIDPQNDFCDLPRSLCNGNTPALPVSGAHDDMLRLAAMIEQCGKGISQITVTLDSHHRIDISHPGFWRQGNGDLVAPFTQIRTKDVEAGTFRPLRAELLPQVLNYLNALTASGRYTHMIWPTHCELGSWGHNVHETVRHAYNVWEEVTGNTVAKILKGLNPMTEHYSAIQAEVSIPNARETHMNTALLATLNQADMLLIAGEAGSHCVKATVEHIVEYMPELTKRIVLLDDCISPVEGFENEQDRFIAKMRSKGARTATTGDILLELLDF